LIYDRSIVDRPDIVLPPAVFIMTHGFAEVMNYIGCPVIHTFFIAQKKPRDDRFFTLRNHESEPKQSNLW
jgi:hypothetical protein